MDSQQLVAFACRDRGPVEALRAVHWTAWKLAVPPLQAIELADGLRRHALSLKPHWPDEREREEDLAAHRRVAEALRRVHTDAGP
jgi:hypothetical protein